MDITQHKRVLILYYSFSEQTKTLVEALSLGLRTAGPALAVTTERLETIQPQSLPFPSLWQLLLAMFTAFLGKRVPVKPIKIKHTDQWDLIILAGPTWSYLPSGPVLAFLDGEGQMICRQQRVMALISCRAYWRLHNWYIKRLLRKGAREFWPPLVVTHPTREPWRTFGLFLFLLGRLPILKKGWLRGVYPHYGHNQGQLAMLREKGAELAKRIVALPTNGDPNG